MIGDFCYKKFEKYYFRRIVIMMNNQESKLVDMSENRVKGLIKPIMLEPCNLMKKLKPEIS